MERKGKKLGKGRRRWNKYVLDMTRRVLLTFLKKKKNGRDRTNVGYERKKKEKKSNE